VRGTSDSKIALEMNQKTLQLNPFDRRKMSFMQTTQLHVTNSTFIQQTANKANESDFLSNLFELFENQASETLLLTQQIADSKSLHSGDDLYFLDSAGKLF
jgi:hypothetical protein